ncbi:hypothetical protein EDF63_3462 [Curtobacterium sp. JUb34]|uniref:Druantia anti-phage system protein DruA n=1 Tax=Curtobacterium sp. JUb34 TaxID=2485109 RepID=UPI000F9D7EAB|nr:hypothetical protein EDF63_3462 [Curtobacterium sp. JUb34]
MAPFGIMKVSYYDFSCRSACLRGSAAGFPARAGKFPRSFSVRAKLARALVGQASAELIWGFLAHRMWASVVCKFAVRAGLDGAFWSVSQGLVRRRGETDSTTGSMSSWAGDIVGVALRMTPFEQRCGVQMLDTSAARVSGVLPKRGREWSPDARSAAPCDSGSDGRRRAFVRALRAEGVRLFGDRVVPVDGDVRGALRRQWVTQHAEGRTRERAALEALDAGLDLRVWGWGREDAIDPAKVRPRFVLVSEVESADAALWRWVVLGAGVPVRRGTRRRLRVLVADDGHDGRLIGVLGVGEAFERQPLLHAWCGIDAGATGSDRAWLLHSFEAVGPYAGMFGRKLLAALATSAEFHDLIWEQSGSDVVALVAQEEAERASVLEGFDLPNATAVALGDGAEHDWRVWGEAAQILLDAARTRLREAPATAPAEGIALGSPLGRSGLAALGLPARHPRLFRSAPRLFVLPMVSGARAALRGNSTSEARLTIGEVASWWERGWGRRALTVKGSAGAATRPGENRSVA